MLQASEGEPWEGIWCQFDRAWNGLHDIPLCDCPVQKPGTQTGLLDCCSALRTYDTGFVSKIVSSMWDLSLCLTPWKHHGYGGELGDWVWSFPDYRVCFLAAFGCFWAFHLCSFLSVYKSVYIFAGAIFEVE